MSKPIMAWWFVREDRRLRHGDGRTVHRGVTHVHHGPLSMCHSGLHASVRILDAMEYAPGATLCRVSCSGVVERDRDKLVCTRRRYEEVFDARDLLWKFARLCALDVIDLWTPPDVVTRYLRTGNDELHYVALRAVTRRQNASMSPTQYAIQAAVEPMLTQRAEISARFAALASRNAMKARALTGAEVTAADKRERERQNRRLHGMAIRLIAKVRGT